MASLIPGFEYDIFISYRQKDNKGDRWVSEFVEALKTELESTFKEDVSVYFDINPHDGLLETHDVDASVKDKLKCLIFIPIISRTYCDPKSFAWEHEFKAFVAEASKDQFGLKVKLPNSNVTSRILPVQIYELDAEDRNILESELGGYLRGIEFIYKEPGVNRPLMADEDHPDNNLNKTFYRNQINKVANAVSEIIGGLKNQLSDRNVKSKDTAEEKPFNRKVQKSRFIAGILILLALIIAGYFILSRLKKPTEQLEKSIAVLPFRNDSPNDSTTYFINGLMEEILNNLQKIKDFRVLSRTSTEQYRVTTIPTITRIAKQLGVNYIVEGSGQKYGNTFRLRVQLIKATKEGHLWAESYEKEIKGTKDIFGTQSEIAQSIASALKATLTPEEKQLIEKSPTISLTAYDFYQRGNDELSKYMFENAKNEALEKAENLFKQSLKNDSTFAKAYVGLSWVFAFRHYSESYLSKNFLDSVLILANKALSFDSKLSDAFTTRGLYYEEKGVIEKAAEEFDRALQYNPNDILAYNVKAYLSFMCLRDFVDGIDNMHKAVARNRGSDLPDYLRTLGSYYLDAGFIDKAKYYFQEAFDLDRDSTKYLSQIALIEYDLENFTGAYQMAKKANGNDTTKLINLWLLTCLPLNYKEEILKQYERWIEYSKRTGNLLMGDYYRIAIALWRMDKHKEAKTYFDLDIKYLEGSFKLGRSYVGFGGSNYSLAAIYSFLGDKIKAYKYLEGLNKLRSQPWSWVIFLKNDPCFDNIRNEERFQKIIQDIEAKYQAEHERVRKWLEEKGML